MYTEHPVRENAIHKLCRQQFTSMSECNIIQINKQILSSISICLVLNKHFKSSIQMAIILMPYQQQIIVYQQKLNITGQ